METYHNDGEGRLMPARIYEPLTQITGDPIRGYRVDKGPDTYLNGARYGWPHDHSVDDAYECPPYVWRAPDNKASPWGRISAEDPSELAAQAAFLKQMTTTHHEDPPEYTAEFGSKGEAILVKSTKSTTRSVQFIASFETMADAQTAAEALNEHHGY